MLSAAPLSRMTADPFHVLLGIIPRPQVRPAASGLRDLHRYYARRWSDVISASGALNLPRRKLAGSTASIASSFSVGSTRR